jgi:2,4-diaminopentanoate dehydrogenase
MAERACLLCDYAAWRGNSAHGRREASVRNRSNSPVSAAYDAPGGDRVFQRLRVAHIGTGRTGRAVLRLILATPGLDLVGHYVHTADKVGRDSGDLVDEPPAGVLAINDLEAFLAIDADCVTYMATDAGRAFDDVVEQLCAILGSGKNVVTTTLGELVYPPLLAKAPLAKLEAACQAGGSSLLAAGIAPGFAMDVLPVQLATLCKGPTKVVVSERILCGTYSVPGFFTMLGFGTTPDGNAQAYQPGTGAAMFGSPIRLMAHGLGWTLDEVRDRKDVAVARHDFSCPAGDVAAGTIISVRIVTEGVIDGEPRLVISEAWTLTDDVVDDWDPRPTADCPPRLTRITIDGTPSVSVDLALDGSPLPGADATAARVVNAVGAVCAAEPGVHGALDLAIEPRLSANARR